MPLCSYSPGSDPYGPNHLMKIPRPRPLALRIEPQVARAGPQNGLLELRTRLHVIQRKDASPHPTPHLISKLVFRHGNCVLIQCYSPPTRPPPAAKQKRLPAIPVATGFREQLTRLNLARNPKHIIAGRGTNPPGRSQHCVLYHIFALGILPDLNWRNINVARPCEVAVFDISTFEECRIA